MAIIRVVAVTRSQTILFRLMTNIPSRLLLKSVFKEYRYYFRHRCTADKVK